MNNKCELSAIGNKNSGPKKPNNLYDSEIQQHNEQANPIRTIAPKTHSQPQKGLVKKWPPATTRYINASFFIKTMVY